MNPEFFREGLFEEPGRCLLATLSSHPETLKSNPNYMKALAKAYADRVISGAIAQLETRSTNLTPHTAAQHNKQKEQERQEGRKKKKTFTTTTFLGEERVQNHLSIAKHLSGGALPTGRPAHRDRKPDPCVTEEALVFTVLLNNLDLEDIDDLGYPTYHMGTDSDNLLDPPWFTRPDMLFVPRLVALDENRNPVDLPYLRYTLADDEPMLLGTQERDQTVHHAELVAMPAPPPPFPSSIQDSDLELLYLDHPFNWAVNHALYCLGDAGVLADVHRYRTSYGHLRALKCENEKLTRIIGAIQKEQEAHNLKIQTFIDRIKGIKKHLTDARVQTRLHPILACLSIEGMHQDPLYPYGMYPELPTNKELVEAAFQPPTLSQRPPTPIPPTRYLTPLNKPSGVLFTTWSPSPALEYSIELFAVRQPLAAESPYLPVTPTDPPTMERARTPPSDRLSPRSDSPPDQGQSLSCTSSPDLRTSAIPLRVADYTAGNSKGPHHQPVLHDKPCSPGLHMMTWGLPPEVFMAGLMSQGRRPSFWAIPRPQCFYCTKRSHRSAECPNPHERCHQGQHCIVLCPWAYLVGTCL